MPSGSCKDTDIMSHGPHDMCTILQRVYVCVCVRERESVCVCVFLGLTLPYSSAISGSINPERTNEDHMML